MNEPQPCRMKGCHRQALPHANLCDAHFTALVDRALRTPRPGAGTYRGKP